MPTRALTLALLTPAVAGVFLLGVEAVNASRIIYGLHVGIESLGGATQQDAQMLLAQRFGIFLDTPLTLTGGGVTITRTPRQLGVQIDTEATLAQAWDQGRSGALLSDLSAQLTALVSGTTLIPVVRIDDAVFAANLADAFRAIDHPAQDAALRWDTKRGEIVRVPEQAGRIVDRAMIRASLLEAAASLKLPPAIAAEEINDAPRLAINDLGDVETRAREVVSRAPITLKAGDTSRQVTRLQLGLWLTTKPDPATGDAMLILDETHVNGFLEREIVPSVNREAVDARFRMENGRVTTFALARDGQDLNLEEARAVLTLELLGGTAREITLPVAITPPQIGNNAAEELGIRELLAAGESDFKGSPANRIHNIKVGTARFSGVLIKPGEEFSFNTILGPVGPQTGYKPELVIKQNKTVPEYGGGLCQVATTAFRAAVYAGLPITERRSHAYVVRYYGTPGFDATIYPPHPDLRFTNDTGHHILVQTNIVGTKLRFEFYGTADGRKVELVGPRVYGQKPDGSAKATLTMRVLGADGTTREQTFNSSYRSAALYPIDRRNPLE